MAAFRCMLQVGIKTENCLMRYRALKAHSTSSSSSSKEFSKKKMLSHLKQEAAEDEVPTQMYSQFAAQVERAERDIRYSYKSHAEALDRDIQKVQIGTFVTGLVLFVAFAEAKWKKIRRRSP